MSFSTSSLHSNPPAYSHISSSFAPQGHALPVAGGLSCQWQERRFRGLVSPSAPMPRAAFWPNGAHLHLAWPGHWQWPSRSVAGRQRECRQAASGRWPDHGRPLFRLPALKRVDRYCLCGVRSSVSNQQTFSFLMISIKLVSIVFTAAICVAVAVHFIIHYHD